MRLLVRAARRTVALSILLLLAAGAADSISLEWVRVGDPSNAPDPLTGYGATDPNALYHAAMSGSMVLRQGRNGAYVYVTVPGREQHPIGYLDFWDALRFTNWLHNGEPVGPQGAATTEEGAYTFTAEHQATLRNPGARVFVPSEDEWYKAAYYDGVGGYFLYPTSSNVRPTCEPPPGGTDSAACDRATEMQPVGSYPLSLSPWGTLDQAGNAYEWNENAFSGSYGARGGSVLAVVGDQMISTFSANYDPYKESSQVGFRVASRIPLSPRRCGLGFELAPVLVWLALRRRSGRPRAGA